MTNVITEDMEVFMAEEVEISKSEMNWQKNVEIFWTIFINSTIVTLLGVMIFIYSTREFEPVPDPIVDYTPKETFFLKCAVHVDRDFLKGIWNTEQQMPPTTHEDYRETLTLEQETLQQLITNYTCDYWPEHKVMT